MNSKDSMTWNAPSLTRTRTHSLEFSRHLCGSPRPKALTNKRPSKSFSDTDAMGLLGQTTHGRYREINGRKPMFVGQPANRVERMSQKQVYNTDDSFHRKYGNKNERLDLQACKSSTRFVNSPVNSVLHCHSEMNVDDDARSFCDSVSSIACSNFVNADTEKERARKNPISDKIAKFDVIETWLQQLPKPVF